MGHSIKQRLEDNNQTIKMNSLVTFTCLMVILSLCHGYSINRRGQNSRSWNKRSDRQNSGFNPGRNGNGGFNNGNGGFNNGNSGYNNGNGGFNNGNGGYNNGNGGFNNGNDNNGFNHGNSGYNPGR